MTHAMLPVEKVEHAALAAANERNEEARDGKRINADRTQLIYDIHRLAAAARGGGQELMSVSLEHFSLFASFYKYPENIS